MLRISIFDEPHSVTMKIEGSLSGEWVEEAYKAWKERNTGRGNKSIILDLFGVSFVDEAGRALLAQASLLGAKLVGSGPFVSEIIRQLEGEPRKKTPGVLPKIFMLLGLILCLGTLARAQSYSTEPLSLAQALKLAKENSRRLKSQRLEVANAADAVAIAKTKRLPTLSTDIYGSGMLGPLSFEFERGAFGDFPNTGPIPDKNTKVTAERTFSLFATAQLKQPISQLYRINLGVRAQQAAEKMAREQARKTEQELMRDVRRGYFGIVQSQSALEASRANAASLKELDRVLADRLREEAALPADAMETKAALARSTQEALTLENELAARKEQLNLLLGRDPMTDFAVEAVPPAIWEEEDLVAAKARALEMRPELREAKLRIEAADYQRRVKRSERLPDVGAFVSYLSPFNVDVIPKNISAAGIQLTWEPFDWGRRGRELSQKQREVEQANLAEQNSRDVVMMEVSRAFRGLREARGLVQATQLAAAASVERLRVVKNQFEQKAVLPQALLEAQAKLAEAKHRQQEALLAFWNAKAEFSKVIGEDEL